MQIPTKSPKRSNPYQNLQQQQQQNPQASLAVRSLAGSNNQLEKAKINQIQSIIESAKCQNQNLAIRSAESMRNAALCYYLIYMIDDAITKQDVAGAHTYLSYLEDITVDRIKRITLNPQQLDGVFVSRLAEYREVLSNPVLKHSNTRHAQILQALDAFKSGNKGLLKQMCQPRLTYGAPMVDIEMLALSKTMLSLWELSYDELTPAQALQLYNIWAMDTSKKNVYYLNAHVMFAVQLFLENEVDTDWQDCAAVNLWTEQTNALFQGDAKIASWQDTVHATILDNYLHISKEFYKYFALMELDYDTVTDHALGSAKYHIPSGITRKEWCDLYAGAFFYESGEDWREYALSAKADATIGKLDIKALQGLSERYPGDPKVQEALDRVNAQPELMKDPEGHRPQSIKNWHALCYEAHSKFTQLTSPLPLKLSQIKQPQYKSASDIFYKSV